MSKFELKLPKMGESVAEATITSWLKEIGDTVELDEAIVEIATDKVDSEVPSEVEGILIERLFNVEDVVEVGTTIAIIETKSDSINQLKEENISSKDEGDSVIPSIEPIRSEEKNTEQTSVNMHSPSGKFYSPLVKNIAKAEGVSINELESITGTGKDGRVTKNDIFAYLNNAGKTPIKTSEKPKEETTTTKVKPSSIPLKIDGGEEIIELTRMGKLIAKHMVDSIHTSAHVQSFIEVDVTNIVDWRNRVKEEFYRREGEKITFTPIFMQAIAKAIKDFPMVNISFDGEKIIKHNNINLGMAAALADGNLIVPVIKKADLLSLVGMTKAVNDLAGRARTGDLSPDDIQDGTYTVTNVGSFGSIMGTPIINQPQVAILALGAIRKKPSVVETPEGDFIGIRHKMIISHSYDHRVVNGALGGMFIKKVADYLEAWDAKADY